jgi:hypothetical protein
LERLGTEVAVTMIQKSPDWTKTYVYRAPMIFVGFFYLILLVWTAISVSIMGAKGWVNWLQLFMVAFIFVMTWYFSMGISYKAEINDDGKLELLSFRRVIKIHSTKIVMVEGPHLPLGFIRFRLEREKAYLFGVPKNRDLQQILSIILKTNPEIRFKNLHLSP